MSDPMLDALLAPADRPLLDSPVMDPLDGFERYGLDLARFPSWEALAAEVEAARTRDAYARDSVMFERLSDALVTGVCEAMGYLATALRPFMAMMNEAIREQAARERRQWQVVARRRR